MRFGMIQQTTTNADGTSKTTVKKFRDYNEYVNETIHEERVQIMKITDFDLIAQQMHIDHALQDHGCWVEHQNDKMYVIKRWITKN